MFQITLMQLAVVFRIFPLFDVMNMWQPTGKQIVIL